MKSFLDLQATELTLTVTIDGHTVQHGLLEPLTFDIDQTVFVDGIEVLPKYLHLALDQKLTINEPFYRWYHRVSGQGWLLNPQ
jgi:hypothetical protein